MEDLFGHSFFFDSAPASDNIPFSGFEGNELRVKFLLSKTNLEGLKQFPSNLDTVGKNAKLSYEFRVKGNDFFTEYSKLTKAVREYTKSVAHAPTGSQEIALAYANRSAALFKARLISDCLLDIERALENNYPDNLKAKLYLRKAMCLQILESRNDPSIKEAFAETREWVKKMDDKNKIIMEEMLAKQEKVTSINKSTLSKWDGKKFLPKLSAENPKIPGLSDAVEMQYSEKYGRHMIATRDIKPGEVIVVQKAYSSVVRMNSRYTLCWNCCEETWASIPCENCVVVVFCSEICREKAMLDHHDIECPVIASLIAMNHIELEQPNMILMSLRLAVKALKEMNNSFESLRQNIEKVKAGKNLLLKRFTNNVLEPNKFSSVYCLSGHTKTDITVFKISFSIFMAFLLATKTLYFGSRMNDDWETLSSKNDFVFVVALLEKVIGVSEKNAFGTHEKNIGFRLIILALSFFNHSCIPMVARTDHHGYIAKRALRPIKKGEQIFCSYGPNYKHMPINEWKKCFSLHNFVCGCEACENDWPLEKKNKKMNEGVEMISLQFSEACSFLSLLLEKYHPKKNNCNDYPNLDKDVARGVESLQKFYRLRRQPNSLEIFLTRDILSGLLSLTSDRVLSLD